MCLWWCSEIFRCDLCSNIYGRGVVLKYMKINVREYRRGNQKLTIQINWQHRVHKMKKNKPKSQHNMSGHHYIQTNTINVNKKSLKIPKE